MARFLLTVREAVSLLLANGHPQARHYPISRIFLEADIIRRRLDRERAEAATLMQLCVGSLFGGKTGDAFAARIAEMVRGP